MAQALSSHSNATLIHSPRATDAVGAALRNAYVRSGDLPDDIERLLVNLSETGQARPWRNEG